MRLRSYISAPLLLIYLFSIVGSAWMSLSCCCNAGSTCHSHCKQIEACAHHCGVHHHHHGDEDCFAQRCCTYGHSTEIALYLPSETTKNTILQHDIYISRTICNDLNYSLDEQTKGSHNYLYLPVPIDRIYAGVPLRAPPTLA